ncbi:uncharacterized protein LOC126902066 [Daktulosphaira vitifoliae]|uniref:uncharacterized protein LOC126902066 n=1 Tax=Daktulosphaira vitifoliae TaxID=58002 RepID=UPI0021A9DBF2|nr:uncharacterized protein LOC126902066 [Daktulosphaira vitifoliae]
MLIIVILPQITCKFRACLTYKNKMFSKNSIYFQLMAFIFAVTVPSRLVADITGQFSDYDRLQAEQMKLQEEIQEKLYKQQLIQQQILLLQYQNKIPLSQYDFQSTPQIQLQPVQPDIPTQQPPQQVDESIAQSKIGNDVSFKNISITEDCLSCICEVMSKCDHNLTCEGEVCGPFQITWAYWIDAGKIVQKGDNPNDSQAFGRCANDITCAKEIVISYTLKFAQDCNNDGIIDCWDYALIHMYGGYNGCKNPFSQDFKKKYDTCIEQHNKNNSASLCQFSEYDRLQAEQIKLQVEIQEKLYKQQLIQQQILLLQHQNKIPLSQNDYQPTPQIQSQSTQPQFFQPYVQVQQPTPQIQPQSNQPQQFPPQFVAQENQVLKGQQDNQQIQAQEFQQSQLVGLHHHGNNGTYKIVPITEVCLACICEVMSKCDRNLMCEGEVCGAFRITWAYWADAGKPVQYGDNPNNEQAFVKCANDLVCAKQSVLAYTSRFSQDCNGDGLIDCWDYALIHRYGGYSGCKNPFSQEFKNKFDMCQKSIRELSGSQTTNLQRDNNLNNQQQNPAAL